MCWLRVLRRGALSPVPALERCFFTRASLARLLLGELGSTLATRHLFAVETVGDRLPLAIFV
eukprot:335618-Chlamydomonas_euryale.AAC.1